MVVVSVLIVRGVDLVSVLRILVVHWSLGTGCSIELIHFDVCSLFIKQWCAEVFRSAVSSWSAACSSAEASKADAAEASEDAKADNHSNLADVARVLISTETVDGTAAWALVNRYVLHDTILDSTGTTEELCLVVVVITGSHESALIRECYWLSVGRLLVGIVVRIDRVLHPGFNCIFGSQGRLTEQ